MTYRRKTDDVEPAHRPSSAGAIVQGVFDGHPASIRDLIERYGNKIAAALESKFYIDSDVSARIELETILFVCENIHLFNRDKSSFDAWVIQRASYLALDYFKKNPRPIKLSTCKLERLLASQCSESESLRRKCRELKLRAMRLDLLIKRVRLTRFQKEVLARTRDGQDIASIADDLNSTNGSVRSALSKIVRALRNLR